ncbi:ABC transporter permease [Citricoccus alkalitolerans]|uniref:ABC transporter permease n=1 Tax=Citricoccus alkalitolerans TaxID=246603 RepID=A0ABV8XV69_9MICC
MTTDVATTPRPGTQDPAPPAELGAQVSSLPGRRPGARRARRRPGLLLAWPVPLVVLGLWTLGVEAGWVLPFDIRLEQLPRPADVAVRLGDLAVGGIINDPFSGQLWANAWASLVRAVSGFALAAAVAIPLGLLMGRSRLLTALLEPTINVVRPIPVTAWAPLTLLMIGIGDRSAIFLVFLAAFFPILMNTVTAVMQVPERLNEAAAMLGTPSWQRLYKVVLPAAMPGIVSGLRVAMGLAWALLVVGEMTGITVGLGAMISEARVVAKTDLIVAGMVIIGLLGFLTDRALVLAVKAVFRGRPILQDTKAGS